MLEGWNDCEREGKLYSFPYTESVIIGPPSSAPLASCRDVNHMHFASGEAPPFVQDTDILSPISQVGTDPGSGEY